MRKIIACINTTLDGFCDHTAIVPDEELHHHYADLLRGAGTLLYGRVTYGLMEYWRPFVDQPSGDQAMDAFARAIDNVEKVVFSRTLKAIDWPTARLAQRSLEEEVRALRLQAGNPVYVGSPGLIRSLTEFGLIDEYQLCVHPVIAGSGLQLFGTLNRRVELILIGTKAFNSGAVILYHTRTN